MIFFCFLVNCPIALKGHGPCYHSRISGIPTIEFFFRNTQRLKILAFSDCLNLRISIEIYLDGNYFQLICIRNVKMPTMPILCFEDTRVDLPKTSMMRLKACIYSTQPSLPNQNTCVKYQEKLFLSCLINNYRRQHSFRLEDIFL